MQSIPLRTLIFNTDQEGRRGVESAEEAQAREEGIGGGSGDVPAAGWLRATT